ncbi:MAG: hypothetical protein BWX96_00636 [Bacteroidetes bacterium ADurb.Bin145]|nr:MAG: hypothetical protein BWX96_00636 [Bacteroidetes bacterium ADurb.Bin145]
MKLILPVILFYFNLISYPQSLSDNDIKVLAQKINNELQGMDFGNGINVKGCYALGRTLVYQYLVNEDWYAPNNMKIDLIENIKKSGYSEMYFNNDINVEYQYFYENRLREKISINSYELVDLNFNLGEYISIDGHPKSKGVNLKLRPPIGWQIEEGDRPNIVQKFLFKNNNYMIMVKDNIMFFSRNEIREILSDDEYVNEFLSEASSLLTNPQLLNYRVVSVDKYPSLEFTMRGEMERLGIKMSIKQKCWMVFFEDKIVYLQCGGLDNNEFTALEKLYDLITYSVIFPEQYDY